MKYITGTITENAVPVEGIKVVGFEDTEKSKFEKIVGYATTGADGKYLMGVADYIDKVIVVAREDRGELWTPDTPKSVDDRVHEIFSSGDQYWNQTTVRILGETDFTNLGNGSATRTIDSPLITTDEAKFGAESISFYSTGAALLFDNDVVYDTNGEISTDLTIEFWLWPHTTSLPTAYYMMGRQTFVGFQVAIYNNGWISFEGSSAVSLSTSAGTIVEKVWQHIAIVRSGTAWNLYINGVSQDSDTESGLVSGEIAGDFGIGKSSSGQFTGYLDDIRVTKAARYTTNFTPPSTPLPLADDSGNVFICTQAGTTGSSTPATWDSDGSTTDGTVLWDTKAFFKPVVEGPIVPEFEPPDTDRMFVTRASNEVYIMQYLNDNWAETRIPNITGLDIAHPDDWKRGSLAVSGDAKTIFAGYPTSDEGGTDWGGYYYIKFNEVTQLWESEWVSLSSLGIGGGSYWAIGLCIGTNYDGTVVSLCDNYSNNLIVRRKVGETWNTYVKNDTLPTANGGGSPMDNSGDVTVVGDWWASRFSIYRWNGTDDYVKDADFDVSGSSRMGNMCLSKDGNIAAYCDHSASTLRVYAYTGSWSLRESFGTGIPASRIMHLIMNNDCTKAAIAWYSGSAYKTYLSIYEYTGSWASVATSKIPNIGESRQFAMTGGFNQTGDRLYVNCVPGTSHTSGATVAYELLESNGWEPDGDQITPILTTPSYFSHVIRTPNW